MSLFPFVSWVSWEVGFVPTGVSLLLAPLELGETGVEQCA